MSEKKSIVICWIGIGDYNIMFDNFYNSFNEHFCTECDRTFFIFTNKPKIINGKNNCVVFKITKPCTVRGWILFRKFKYLMMAEEHYIKHDYVCFMNGNMICQKDVTLNELIADKKYACIIHPNNSFLKKDVRLLHPSSMASFKPTQNIKFKQAGWILAETMEFLKMANTIEGWRYLDKANGKERYVTRHDEAYYNKYMSFHEHETNHLLAKTYLCPSRWPTAGDAKMVQVNKELTFKQHNLFLDPDISPNDGYIYTL